MWITATPCRRWRVSITLASSIAEATTFTGEELKAGTKLIIPISPTHHDTQSAAYSKHPTHYKVRKGDTVASVADDFEVPVDKLRKWNHLRGGELVPGRTLVIYKPLNPDSAEAATTDVPPGRSTHLPAPLRARRLHRNACQHYKTTKAKATAAAQTAKYHKVERETPSSIAELNHVSQDLKRENPNLDAKVRPGEVLLIRANRAIAATSAAFCDCALPLRHHVLLQQALHGFSAWIFCVDHVQTPSVTLC